MANFYIPEIISGCGTLKAAGSKASELGAKNVLILTDRFLVQTNDFKIITDSLESYGISWNVFPDVQSNPTAKSCETSAAIAYRYHCDLIIGFGGGSAMDQAKTCAALLTNGKTCNYWDGIPLNRPMMPTICIPTTSGTGSEVTFVAVITDPVREYKMSIGDPKHLLPTCAICDPLVTLGLPQTLTASCGIDALTHAIEAFTSKASSAATDALALRAITLIARNINRAWEHPDDISARDAMMTGSTLAGSAFINSNVGAVHALAETVGAKYHIPHGTANAIFLPYVMKFNLPKAADKYSEVAHILADSASEDNSEHTAMDAVTQVTALCKKMSIPSLNSYPQITPGDFPLLSKRAAENPLSDDNPRIVTEQDYLHILNQAFA